MVIVLKILYIVYNYVFGFFFCYIGNYLFYFYMCGDVDDRDKLFLLSGNSIRDLFVCCIIVYGSYGV